MKALKFLGNRVEDAANAFIDVLKYSDQSVDTIGRVINKKSYRDENIDRKR